MECKVAPVSARDETLSLCIEPAPEEREGGRRACNRDHVSVVLADRDHVFFESTRHHRHDVVCDLLDDHDSNDTPDRASVHPIGGGPRSRRLAWTSSMYRSMMMV